LPILTEQLTKYYGRSRGIAGVDLEVRQGEIFGFLGPNGAGKTTTIRLLLGFIRPTSGQASVLGLDVRRDSLAIRERVGYIPGDVRLYEELTGSAFLDYMAGFRKSRTNNRRRELADRLDINLSVRLKQASRGMKQKVAIVQALMHDPDLLILDEPTSGLDPLVQSDFYGLLKEEQGRGKTVFLSSHILSEVEKVCDRVAIIREGRIEVVEDIHGLKSRRVKVMEVTFTQECPPAELEVPGVLAVEGSGRHYRVSVRGDVNPLLRAVAARRVENVIFHDASLEDIFMEFYQATRRQGEGRNDVRTG